MPRRSRTWQACCSLRPCRGCGRPRRGFGAATAEAFAWSGRVRDLVIAGYEGAAVPGATGDPTLLRALEVAKEWREAVYAARVLPEWLYAPRLVLEKLLA